jgi:hypothetical protein
VFRGKSPRPRQAAATLRPSAATDLPRRGSSRPNRQQPSHSATIDFPFRAHSPPLHAPHPRPPPRRPHRPRRPPERPRHPLRPRPHRRRRPPPPGPHLPRHQRSRRRRLANPNAWLPASPLPKPLPAAILDVAAAFDFAPDWLNPGPTDLLQFDPPPGFADRTTIKRFGALTVRYASRVDQVALKRYAADPWPTHNAPLQDLLTPTPTELTNAAAWCLSHDPSPGFRNVQLRPLLDHLGAP